MLDRIITMKKQTILQIALYAVLVTLLFIYAELGAYLYDITRTYYTAHFTVFSYMFAVVFGFTLFIKLSVSIKSCRKRPCIFYSIVFILTTLITVFIYLNSSFQNITLYSTLFWTEVTFEIIATHKRFHQDKA